MKRVERKKFYIYVLFRLNGEPCYVGKGFGDRWLWHERHPNHHNKNLLNIVNQAKKLCKELPKVKIRQKLTEAEAFDLEKIFIKVIGRKIHGGPLVNLTGGGDGESGKVYTPQQIENFINGARNRPRPTSESNTKRSIALKGRKKSAEHIAKVAEANRGKKKKRGWWSTEEGRAKQQANNPGNTGHRHSEKTK